MAGVWHPGYIPQNALEESLFEAAARGDTQSFLDRLRTGEVMLPIPPDTPGDPRPGPGFPWPHAQVHGELSVLLFTSPPRLRDAIGDSARFVTAPVTEVIGAWPRDDWALAVNPDTPIGCSLPGTQVRSWAADAGLPPGEIMQKAVPPDQVVWYLDHGYDRVAGFVHRLRDTTGLTTAASLHEALGLPAPDDAVHVIRWPAYRADLYESTDHDVAIPQFRIGSLRVPHDSVMSVIRRDGTMAEVAVYDADLQQWREVPR